MVSWWRPDAFRSPRRNQLASQQRPARPARVTQHHAAACWQTSLSLFFVLVLLFVLVLVLFFDGLPIEDADNAALADAQPHRRTVVDLQGNLVPLFFDGDDDAVNACRGEHFVVLAEAGDQRLLLFLLLPHRS